nr:MAG: coat protein [Inner Mongolia phenui-like virus 2]
MDADKLFQVLSSKDLSIFSADEFDKFRFQGFDPNKIAETLLKIKKEKNVPQDIFERDVVVMVGIAVLKGSVTENNLKRISEEGRQSITDLQKKYGIVHGGGQGQAASVITYPRVAATFPDVAIRMIALVGARDYPGQPMQSVKLPAFMKQQVFASVIPRQMNSAVQTYLLKAVLCYSVDQTIAIGRVSSPDIPKLLATQGPFVKLAHQSPVAKEEARVELFKSLDWTGVYKMISGVIAKYQSYDKDYTPPSEDAFNEGVKI